MKKKNLVTLAKLVGSAAVLAVLVGCASNPVTGEADFVLMSEQSEIKLGQQNHQAILKQYQVYENSELQQLVNDLGQQLARESHRSHLEFAFTLLDSPQVNAFALPGGYIYITRGIMAYMNNQEELAGVLGHEIGHVTARHGVRQHSAQTTAGLIGAIATIATGSKDVAQLSNQLGGALVRGYGRKHELEADRLGAEYLALSGYDPEKMLGVVGILKDQEQFELQRAKEEGREPRIYHGVFSTHPRNDQRLQEVIRAADRFKNSDAKETNPEDFLRLMEGVTFGSSEEQGIVRENRFYHKPLNLSITFPESWRIDNQPTQLVVIRQDQEAAFILQIDEAKKGESSAAYLKRKFPKLQSGQSLGANSYTGLIQGNTPFGLRTARVASIFHENKVFVLSGFAKEQLSDRGFFDTVKSVRGLNREERKLASAKKIKLVRAKKGDTFARLAQSIDIGEYGEEQLRLLNGYYPTGEPKPGQLIKTVE